MVHSHNIVYMRATSVLDFDLCANTNTHRTTEYTPLRPICVEYNICGAIRTKRADSRVAIWSIFRLLLQLRLLCLFCDAFSRRCCLICSQKHWSCEHVNQPRRMCLRRVCVTVRGHIWHLAAGS